MPLDYWLTLRDWASWTPFAAKGLEIAYDEYVGDAAPSAIFR
jgi:hypothetical protein